MADCGADAGELASIDDPDFRRVIVSLNPSMNALRELHFFLNGYRIDVDQVVIYSVGSERVVGQVLTIDRYPSETVLSVQRLVPLASLSWHQLDSLVVNGVHIDARERIFVRSFTRDSIVTTPAAPADLTPCMSVTIRRVDEHRIVHPMGAPVTAQPHVSEAVAAGALITGEGVLVTPHLVRFGMSEWRSDEHSMGSTRWVETPLLQSSGAFVGRH